MEQKINLTDISYIAGLFDGNGFVTYSKTPRKRKGKKNLSHTWNIRMEICMTNEPVIRWIHEILKAGTFSKKPPGKGQLGRKMQYRWRCSHRDAYQVAKLIWPFVQVKIHKIEQIIDHYEPEYQNSNVVSLEAYRNE
jgi:hypothetical protein